jgi:Copper amine oxidase, enzyme domain
VINRTYEGRANVEFVVRMAAAIGNYGYLFDWVFNDAAEIEVRVGATGIDALKVLPRHSYLSARMGSTRLARCAGIKPAAADTTVSNIIVPMAIHGSLALMP